MRWLAGCRVISISIAELYKAKAPAHSTWFVEHNIGTSNEAKLREVLPKLPVTNCPGKVSNEDFIEVTGCH